MKNIPDKIKNTRSHANFHTGLIRIEVIKHYSDGKSCCVRCGCDNFHLLSVDHINNDGAEHRKTMNWGNIYSWLSANNYPKGFQILCRNCNWLKNVYFTKKYEQYRKKFSIKQEEFDNLDKIDFPYYSVPDELFN